MTSNLSPAELALLANFPAAPAPAGLSSNFDASAPNATTLWVVTVLTVAISFFAVLIRIYVKQWISKQRMSWDDGACIIALLAAIAHAYITLKNLDYGLGKHMWDIRALSFTHKKLLSLTLANLVIAINMFFVRTSVLALYLRLFSVYRSSETLIYLGFILAILVAIPEIGVATTRMIKCTSLTAGLTDHFCNTKSTSTAVVIFACSFVLIDTFIYLIAIFRVRGLQVKIATKVQLSVVFAVGFLACAASVGNLIFVGIYFHTTDQLWYALWVAMFKILEANIALTCACATFFPAFWKKQMPAVSSMSSSLRMRPHKFSTNGDSVSKKYGHSKGHRSDGALVDSPYLELSERAPIPQIHASQHMV